MPDSVPAVATELLQVEEAFGLAMTSNDISRIGACIADDWVLVTPEVLLTGFDARWSWRP